ncbi:hypothetical protein, partial [Neisseria weaveri]|uniref:hypothetical protein n=1 Tax=Neisseria weaveri TaxID=28091 RepID=UPI00280BE6FE
MPRANSFIGSIGGDTVIRADDNVTTRAAVIGAGRNVRIEARNVDIGSLHTGDKFDSQTRSKSRGINIGVAFDPVPM